MCCRASVAGQGLPDGPVSLTLTYVKPSPVLKAYAEVCCVLWQAQLCLNMQSTAVCCTLMFNPWDGSRCSSCAAAGSQPMTLRIADVKGAAWSTGAVDLVACCTDHELVHRRDRGAGRRPRDDRRAARAPCRRGPRRRRRRQRRQRRQHRSGHRLPGPSVGSAGGPQLHVSWQVCTPGTQRPHCCS
jgi:hypothetical protein